MADVRPLNFCRRALSISCLLAGACMLIIFSCGKEGPQGPAGPQGEQGDKGDTGAKGAKGATGVANVIYSAWLTVDLKSGIYASTYYAKINAPKLTQSILDKGDMKVYVKAGSIVYKLPSPVFGGLYARFSVGHLELLSPTDWDTNSGYYYRYVLIPGGTTARKGLPPPDYSDYHAVCRYYNIPE